MVRPALKRPVVDYIVAHYDVSQRRACQLVHQHRSIQWYRSRKDPRLALRTHMREIAQVRVRYGYRRIQVLLHREGWRAGKTLIYRVYREERLQLRTKLPKRRKMVVTRRDVYVPKRPNQAWAMDFVSDQLTNGERFRALTIVDVFTRESLAIEVGRSLRADHVIEVCNRIAAIRGAPVRVFVDNGSEFSGRLLDLWAYHHKVRIDFSRPGKPTDNCFIETFNGSLRDECLNVHWFESIDDAKAKIEAWRHEYNESRPHQALLEQTPAEFARRAKTSELQLEYQPAGN
jgi:putative transposase